MNARINYDKQQIVLQHEGLSVDQITKLRLALANDWEIRVCKTKLKDPCPPPYNPMDDPFLFGIIIVLLLIVALS